MMREPKYKAWDKPNEVMCGVMQIHFDKEIVKLGAPAMGLILFRDVDLLEYTGLKDKNGKECYEGDIVRFSSYYFGDSRIPETIEVIEYEENSFNRHLTVGYSDYPDWCEIIGNIYENPELLEEKS